MSKQISKTEDIEFKPKFIERYSKLTNFEEFKKVSLTFLRRSIRVNTLKITVAELKKKIEDKWILEPIPWCKNGFWIEHKGEEKEDEDGNIEIVKRRDVGNLHGHMLGYFYIQEAASMIPPLVLDPKPGEMVLDLCASPGSKTTQIGMYMKNKGILVANDYKYDRIKSLGLNVQRCGLSNCVITLMMGHLLKKMGEEIFDKILVDAPCSGTGTIRKSFKTLRIWNPNIVKRISGQQKQLIETGFKLLKKGGTMVYSTCTLEPEEDEGIISWLLEKYDNAKVEKIELKGLKRSEPVMEFDGVKYNSQVKDCLRIWPQDNDTEGFFVSKIRKI
ncbi:RsmB/NOP family class I SAM-dependent RNA methyltransferase [Candidatus Woesearchaeota archaeon]|jgi:tRNA (cytosine49-C5)-methyltransferase|nr:RsmB/NOP family class I SAM-dependent RNA methyltransferase [Candidatus Woesearchaeota archaeon]MBT5272913.1 RsmB/NOP family class I SAM-dependent RNA methyltransferase [Candidatus Woesearchaeota archaeon]MBT6041379.1 RsmB/NOP family class I SAM-dependent RNA methyltransferase [Candidatus Woesearchaeota archaeon]MBT6337262.1 RsmB/NOP family class I SAM-dependent RNA methyltransferase [Candidatus Woesearchaeota archaeon]MBT7927139.1 RsmB/NOP family class I SAM-dependent RNA methyltransferase 